MDYLIKLLGVLKQQKQRILFLDIGANIGTFSIVIGNSFKDYPVRGAVMAFEADFENYNLLKENISVNSLSKIVKPVHCYYYRLFRVFCG